MNKEIIICLKEFITVLKNYHEEIGNCDHEVGICLCGEYQLLDEAQEIINKLEKNNEINSIKK